MTLYIFSVAYRNEGWSVAVGDEGVSVVPRDCDGASQVVGSVQMSQCCCQR